MYTIFNFYQFVPLDNLSDLQTYLEKKMIKYDIKGTLVISKEGLNGAVSGDECNISIFVKLIHKVIGHDKYVHFLSKSNQMQFKKQRVRIKKEIIKMNKICLSCESGEYLSPYEWHRFIQRNDVVIFDTRNKIESNIGYFKNSILPDIECFSEFPQYYIDYYSHLEKHTPIAMYCTGGIRCEKTTLLLKEMGFQNVYHLRGGVLAYLKVIPQEISLWVGECYVFDKRVALKHNLEQSTYVHCFACRQPVSKIEQEAEEYIPGLSCKRCFAETKINREKLSLRIALKNKQRGI